MIKSVKNYLTHGDFACHTLAIFVLLDVLIMILSRLVGVDYNETALSISFSAFLVVIAIRHTIKKS